MSSIPAAAGALAGGNDVSTSGFSDMSSEDFIKIIFTELQQQEKQTQHRADTIINPPARNSQKNSHMLYGQGSTPLSRILSPLQSVKAEVFRLKNELARFGRFWTAARGCA